MAVGSKPHPAIPAEFECLVRLGPGADPQLELPTRRAAAAGTWSGPSGNTRYLLGGSTRNAIAITNAEKRIRFILHITSCPLSCDLQPDELYRSSELVRSHHHSTTRSTIRPEILRARFG